ncbi:uncharacterized protein LOC143839051 isoform X1 [Paroedura picta]|uniref:uncharacterized protein LOC143839051 isoform X1 n=1 Tax=Paroedura picta TaxID=143630 RepID=UPI004056CCEC
MEPFTFWSTTVLPTKFAGRHSASSSSLYKDSLTVVPNSTDIPRPTLRSTKTGVKPIKTETFTFWSTTVLPTKFAERHSASLSSLYNDSRTSVLNSTDIPRPTLRPTKIGVKPTKTEAFAFWSTTVLPTKFAGRHSASSSSLYKDSWTAVPNSTDIPRPTLRSTKIGVKPTKMELTFWSTTVLPTEFAERHSASLSSLYNDSRTTVPNSTAIPRPALRPTKIGVKPIKTEAFTFWSTTVLPTKFAERHSASSSSLYNDSRTTVLNSTDIPRPTLGPTKIGLKPTKMEAFTFWSTTVLPTKFAGKHSASSSSLYKDSRTAIPGFTDISSHSVTSQRDLGTLHVLSVHTRPPAFSIFQSSVVPELSPSLMTASMTEFGRQDNLSSITPPISEFLQSHVQQQDKHSTPKKSEQKTHFTQYYLGSSVPAIKTQASRPVQLTMIVSVSREDTPYEKIPVTHFPKEFVTNLAHSRPYAYLTTSRLTSEDIFLTANLPVLSTMSTLVKLKFPFSGVATSLFFSGCSNQDLFSNNRYISESFMSYPQMKEHFFTEENSLPLSAVMTEPFKLTMDLNFIDIASTPDSATTGSASVHELQLAPDTSPVPQLYDSDKTLALTTSSTQEFINSMFTSLAEFELLSRTSRIPTELPSLPLSTSNELTGSFGFLTKLPVEEIWPSSRCMSQKVFKTDEHTSEPFVTVPQTNRLFFVKDLTLTEMYVESPFWNEPSHLIYLTPSGGGVLSSQFLSVDSLYEGASQTYLWHSYDTLLLSLPVESAGTPTLQISTNYFSSYASGVVRISVTYPGILQLETSDLILTSPLGTKTAFPVTWQITSQLLEDPSITSLQAELHATSVFLGVQGKSILPLTPSEESFCGTGAMHTPWLPASLVIPTGQPNTSPRVVNAINWITATIGHKFTFSVPPDTFYDQEDGDTSQLTLGMNPADGSPVGPGNWLHFNSRFQTMRGYPLADDFQYSPQEFLLFATDSEGLKTSDVLTIELLRPTIIPCHHYTIRTKNSYHSFLRERERVYLFLEKLSKYLSSGSPSSMILLGLRPGSTLITWFDNSFCARNNRCSRDEIQGVLLKLRLPSGNVHPDFADAMLPEYNIYHAEDVTYGGTCSSNKSLISNQTISSFKDCHSWTRKSLFALIISMCAAVMIILMMTFWYCKYKKKINGSQSMSFHRKPFVSYADLEMDALKSQKAAILEQEYPWPAELWLPVPTPTQQHPCRSSANLAASMLPPPPKYRLPPLYGTNKPSHTYDNPNRLKSSSKARLY